MTQTILVTGGCGYIGSHAVVELLQANHKVVILDNLCNSSAKVIERIKAIVQIKAQTHADDNTLVNDCNPPRKLRSVFGGNHPTPDGTGIRDYIHVVDLAKGHLKALNKIQQSSEKQRGEKGQAEHI